MTLLNYHSSFNFSAFYAMTFCSFWKFFRLLYHCILHSVKLGNAVSFFVPLKDCRRFLSYFEDNMELFVVLIIKNSFDLNYLIHIKALNVWKELAHLEVTKNFHCTLIWLYIFMYLHLIWAVSMSSQRLKQLLSTDWSYIYIHMYR